MGKTKLLLSLFLFLMIMSVGVSAEVVDIAKTIRYTDFSQGEGINVSYGDEYIRQSSGEKSIYYSEVIEDNSGLIWDKINWDSEIFGDENISLQLRSYQFLEKNTELPSFRMGYDFIDNQSHLGNNEFSSHNGAIQSKGLMGENSSISLLGASDYIKIPDNDNLSTETNNLTLSFYLKFNDYPQNGSNQWILDKGGSGASGDYSVVFDSSGNIRLYLSNGTGTTYGNAKTYAFTGNDIPLNTWLHYVISFDGSKNITYFYLDGVPLSNTTSLGVNNIKQGTSPLYIGVQADTLKDGANFSIGGFSFHDQVLTPFDIEEPMWTGYGIPFIYTHKINESTSPNEENLNKYIDWLNATGRDIINSREYLDMVQGESIIGRRQIQLSVDDGSLTDYTFLYPLLNQYGYYMTTYVPPSTFGDIYEPNNGLKANWSHIIELNNAGWEIGSHTMNEVLFNDSRFEDEISLAYSSICGNISICPESFAYPQGWFNETSNEWVSNKHDIGYSITDVIGNYKAIGYESNNNDRLFNINRILIPSWDGIHSANSGYNRFKAYVYGTSSKWHFNDYLFSNSS